MFYLTKRIYGEIIKTKEKDMLRKVGRRQLGTLNPAIVNHQ